MTCIARVVDVDVVDRQPGRDDPAGCERPVGGCLVPADPLGVAGQLGEQVAVPQHHGVAQQVATTSRRTRVRARGTALVCVLLHMW